MGSTYLNSNQPFKTHFNEYGLYIWPFETIYTYMQPLFLLFGFVQIQCWKFGYDLIVQYNSDVTLWKLQLDHTHTHTHTHLYMIPFE